MWACLWCFICHHVCGNCVHDPTGVQKKAKLEIEVVVDLVVIVLHTAFQKNLKAALVLCVELAGKTDEQLCQSADQVELKLSV